MTRRSIRCAGAAHTLLVICASVAAARLLGLLLLFGRLVEAEALRAGLALLLREAILIRHSLALGARLVLLREVVAPRRQGGRRRGGGGRRRGGGRIGAAARAVAPEQLRFLAREG